MQTWRAVTLELYQNRCKESAVPPLVDRLSSPAAQEQSPVGIVCGLASHAWGHNIGHAQLYFTDHIEELDEMNLKEKKSVRIMSGLGEPSYS